MVEHLYPVWGKTNESALDAVRYCAMLAVLNLLAAAPAYLPQKFGDILHNVIVVGTLVLAAASASHSLGNLPPTKDTNLWLLFHYQTSLIAEPNH